MEEIKPLLARIQELKGGRGGALLGTQLMAFFLQRRIQPLQHRLSKLWTFSGLGDPSRVFENLMEKKDLDKRVRALTTLTKDHQIADLAARYFDSEHPLPAVSLLSLFAFFYLIICLSCNSQLVFLSGSSIPSFSPSTPRGRGHSKCTYFRGLRSPQG
jgi:hypothetical protein